MPRSIPPEVLLSFTIPSERNLLDWLRPHVTLSMLTDIATNDYGDEMAEHLSALRRQLSEAPVTGLLDWCPREVLELERWREPIIEAKDDPATEKQLHVRRMLACVLLLQSAATIKVDDDFSREAYFLDTQASTLVRLVESVINIDDGGTLHALTFLLWLYREVDHARLLPFIAVAVLIIWLENTSTFRCEDIDEVYQWVLREEVDCRLMYGSDIESDRWLVGLNSYENDRGYLWSRILLHVCRTNTGCSGQIRKVSGLTERLKAS